MKATPEDSLRKEYSNLLPVMIKIQSFLNNKVHWYLRSLIYELEPYQRIEITSRIKTCESAISSLRNKQEFGAFDHKKVYTLTTLKDLIGVRVLVFPSSKIKQVNEIIKTKFSGWNKDHVRNHQSKKIIAWKYNGLERSKKIRSEIQIISMLTGKFWEVEHFALYKPHPQYKAIKFDPKINRLYEDVINKLNEFEQTFEQSLKNNL